MPWITEVASLTVVLGIRLEQPQCMVGGSGMAGEVCTWHRILTLKAGMGGDGCLTLFEREYLWEKGRAGQAS